MSDLVMKLIEEYGEHMRQAGLVLAKISRELGVSKPDRLRSLPDLRTFIPPVPAPPAKKRGRKRGGNYRPRMRNGVESFSVRVLRTLTELDKPASTASLAHLLSVPEEKIIHAMAWHLKKGHAQKLETGEYAVTQA